jgi:hypothetical protein
VDRACGMGMSPQSYHTSQMTSFVSMKGTQRFVALRSGSWHVGKKLTSRDKNTQSTQLKALTIVVVQLTVPKD